MAGTITVSGFTGLSPLEPNSRTSSKHVLTVTQSKPLHSLFGEYVKRLRDGGYVESEMAVRILKSSISTMEAFNDVRNNRSLAHDNSSRRFP
jgi:hypothetical protein